MPVTDTLTDGQRSNRWIKSSRTFILGRRGFITVLSLLPSWEPNSFGKNQDGEQHLRGSFPLDSLSFEDHLPQ